jgi:hypothetical protein
MNHSDPDQSAERPPAQSSFLSVPLILLVGLIVFEATSKPGWAAMSLCLKFGWEDFRTAFWLHRTDPSRKRGRSCWWLYVASGLWKVGVSSFAMFVVIFIVEAVMQPGKAQGKDLLQLLLGACLSLFFAFVFSALATLIALASAWWHDVPLWLNGSVRIARRYEEWPPLYGSHNRIGVLIATNTIFVFFALFPLLPLLLIWLNYMHRRRLFAKHPADCWGEEPLPDPDLGAEMGNR